MHYRPPAVSIGLSTHEEEPKQQAFVRVTLSMEHPQTQKSFDEVVSDLTVQAVAIDSMAVSMDSFLEVWCGELELDPQTKQVEQSPHHQANIPAYSKLINSSPNRTEASRKARKGSSSNIQIKPNGSSTTKR